MDQYLDRIVCATGQIEKREKNHLEHIEIVVTDPKVVDIRPDRPGLPPFMPDVQRPCNPDSALPKVKKEAKPVYADGTVGKVRVIRSLHPDLDEEAIDAARRWRFEPGSVRGKPAPVVVTMEMTFSLRK